MYIKDLIEAVRKICPESADYLEKEAPSLPSYTVDPDRDNNTIGDCFMWSETPQGLMHWEKIHLTLVLELGRDKYWGED